LEDVGRLAGWLLKPAVAKFNPCGALVAPGETPDCSRGYEACSEFTAGDFSMGFVCFSDVPCAALEHHMIHNLPGGPESEVVKYCFFQKNHRFA